MPLAITFPMINNIAGFDLRRSLPIIERRRHVAAAEPNHFCYDSYSLSLTGRP